MEGDSRRRRQRAPTFQPACGPDADLHNQGDFDAILARASEELEGKGIQERRVKGQISFRPSGPKAILPEIAFFKDVRPDRFMYIKHGGGLSHKQEA